MYWSSAVDRRFGSPGPLWYHVPTPEQKTAVLVPWLYVFMYWTLNGGELLPGVIGIRLKARQLLFWFLLWAANIFGSVLRCLFVRPSDRPSGRSSPHIGLKNCHTGHYSQVFQLLVVFFFVFFFFCISVMVISTTDCYRFKQPSWPMCGHKASILLNLSGPFVCTGL